MTRIHVSLATLAELIERMAVVERELESRLSQLDRVAAGLALTWRGSASASYAAAHAGCERDLVQMRTALTGLRANVTTVHGNYAAALSANARMWQ